ncbi:unnamed protein product [Effrenium voratum]|nr:unnamed protein product [Effrenium voratum]
MQVAKHADSVLLEADTARRKTSLTKELQAELLPFTAVATAFDDASWGEALDSKASFQLRAKEIGISEEHITALVPLLPPGSSRISPADLKSRLERSESSEARSMAYEIANVASFTTLDRWTQRLMEKMNEPALPGNKPICFDQVLNADRALWVKVADATRSNLVGDPLATKPFGAAFERLSDHPEILCYIAPMPGSFQRPQHDSSTSVQKGSQVLDKSIMALLDILGWEFADKAMPFCECFDALGARYALELGNKAGRVEKLCSLLDVVASERKLSNHQASELQGLLNFASGFYLTKAMLWRQRIDWA